MNHTVSAWLFRISASPVGRKNKMAPSSYTGILPTGKKKANSGFWAQTGGKTTRDLPGTLWEEYWEF